MRVLLTVSVLLTSLFGNSVGAELCKHNSGDIHVYSGQDCSANHRNECGGAKEHTDSESPDNIPEHEHCEHEIVKTVELSRFVLSSNGTSLECDGKVFSSAVDYFYFGVEYLTSESLYFTKPPPKYIVSSAEKQYTDCIVFHI